MAEDKKEGFLVDVSSPEITLDVTEVQQKQTLNRGPFDDWFVFSETHSK